MGYYTSYKLDTEPKIDLTDDILYTMSDGYQWCGTKFGGWSTEEPCKWYDFDQHMKEFSKKREYKDVLFTLTGEGEESGDIWAAYYKNGLKQFARATIAFEPFDETKLK